MAKTKPEDQPSATSWSDEDIGKVLEEVELTNRQVEVLLETVKRLEPIVHNLQVEVASIAPMKESVPLDVAKGVKPDMLYATALQGCIIGIMTSMGPVINTDRWRPLAAKALAMAEEVYRVAVEKHGIK